jgi:hypothetical protein
LKVSRKTFEGPTMRAASILTVHDAPPLGEVVLVPAALTGRSQAELARSMATYLQKAAPNTGAEALSLLRRMFPHTPLAERVAAFAAAMRR